LAFVDGTGVMESTPLWWQLGAVADLVIAISYIGIAAAILAPLVRTGQLRTNRLGMATAAIFVTCAFHHGGHVVHMMLPALGIGSGGGHALRAAFGWDMVVFDIVGAAIAIHYWSLRRTYGSLMHGAKLFDDLRERQRQAVELNDDIVQGLVAAQLALSLDEREMGAEAIADTLAKARAIITDLLGEDGSELALGPGDLVRGHPARGGD
jgi:signal transduction histidine kinase